MTPRPKNRYAQIIENIFFAHFKKGISSFDFKREELEKQAANLRIRLPKNLGDVIYSFRYRIPMPESVQMHTPPGKQWTIRGSGRGEYRFVLGPPPHVRPSQTAAEINIPDATPGIIVKYAMSDEQALLAKVRYNRLIDTFSRVTCYSLQSHLRTSVPGFGQVETDEIYVGVDRRGAHYVFPVQAKGGDDVLNVVQVEQDLAVCRYKFPALICRPIGAQFMADDVIVLFEFAEQRETIRHTAEKHYRLVAPDMVTEQDLAEYRKQTEE